MRRLMIFLVFFFCSSRRRHTSCLSDWSSDVCSSDLSAASASRSSVVSATSEGPSSSAVSAERSEERRVGKECRSRWSPYDSKKKEIPQIAEIRRRRNSLRDQERKRDKTNT